MSNDTAATGHNAHSPGTTAALRLATWNVNSLSVRLPQVLDWLGAQDAAGTPVDVLALQELKLTEDKFPHADLQAHGYHAVVLGQKTYNGVALLIRSATQATAQNVVRHIPGFEDEQARAIAATVAGVRVIGAYFPNGQAPGSDKFAYKMRWLHALRAWVQAEMTRHPALALMGDYNITFDDADVWDPDGLRDTIHCTREEREQLQSLIGLGLHDGLRLFNPPAKTYTWWDYRDLAFRRNRGLRIDHILITEALRQRALACVVDKNPRKNERPSDHTPVVLTLAA